MIIPGINNRWGIPAAIAIDGWIEVTKIGECIHWREDQEEMRRLRQECKDLYGNIGPQTTRDMIYFSVRYKSTKID
jgi:hypothetical protein